MPSEPSVEWSFDASTSPTLRLLAHLPPAGLGGALLLAVVAVVASLVADPAVLLSPSALLVAVLVLVGGPFSLLYLWPMLTDAEQRPSVAEFEGGGGFPFSARSVGTAAVSGAIAIVGLLAAGVPAGSVYALVVGCVLSPLFVAVLTTHGRLEGETLTINRTEIPLARVGGVRSARFGGFAVVWISYARRSGLFLPRLAVLPESEADAVLRRLESGLDASPEIEPPDPTLRAIGVGTGLSFLVVAAFAYRAIEHPTGRLYFAVGFGGFGAILCLIGWRGL
jgi:DNA-directed RNA polymerase subunit H (RpoH/RPB5)